MCGWEGKWGGVVCVSDAMCVPLLLSTTVDIQSKTTPTPYPCHTHYLPNVHTSVVGQWLAVQKEEDGVP